LRRAERSFGPLQVPSQVWTPASVAEMKKFLEDEKFGAICDGTCNGPKLRSALRNIACNF
jgi:hypothetical protein